VTGAADPDGAPAADPTADPAGGAVATATRTLRAALADSGVDVVERPGGVFEATLPGERKLQTTVRLELGDHALAVHAFVARRPDENQEAVYRWLLERNLRMYAVAFAVDSTGDIWLDGRVPLHAVTADEVDRVLGAVATYADESFNTILELGFATSIRKEWEWRRARGESTRNLDAFRHWLERDPPEQSPPP
jgi:Putative bacterial sensory transduction regulator